MGALPLLRPDWPQPPGVRAAMSTRAGGVSLPPFDSLNLSIGVGDVVGAVLENRERWIGALGVRPVWLHLEHGRTVLRLDAGGPEHPETKADAAWTTDRGLACQVSAADCLPVLFALRDGSAVGCAHAGWRGLAAGVLSQTVRAMCAGTGAQASDIQAWLGPCIGPGHFEVGADVLLAFGMQRSSLELPHFKRCPDRDGVASARWLADLPGLATQQLRTAGVGCISLSGLCTVRDASRFFSFRRDRLTGRMAAAIWRD